MAPSRPTPNTPKPLTNNSTDRKFGRPVEGLVLTNLPRWTLVTLLLLGAAFITASSLVYFDTETLPPFALERLPTLAHEDLWLTALQAHVPAALITFPACILLLTKWLQRRVKLHRWIGRITGVLMLFVLVPSGAVLAFEAKGGPIVTAGFLLSGGLIAFFLVRGVIAARRHQVSVHQHSMWHVVAQMSVAVTSRVMLMAFDAAQVDETLGYVVALWVPVISSTLFVELLSMLPSLLERKTRESPSPVGAVLVRAHARVGR